MKGKVLRKTLAAALALLLVSGNIPLKPVTDLFSGAAITASAEGETSNQCGENAFWSFDTATNTLTISGTGAMYNYYDDPQPWNDYRDNITSVVIENGITSIGSSAFDSCAKLTSVSIPDSVTSIGADAFYGCTSLESITIPDGVTSIGNYAFSDCTSLTSLTIPDSVTSIGEFAFVSCEGLKSVEIGSGVTSISECVFAHCKGLESVEIGSNVESIGVNAFFDCTSLTSVTIPDSVTSIRGYAFNGCTSLESITIPDSVTSIGKEAFLNCTNIKDVYCYAAPANLTWDDGDCDDFIKTPKHTTVCHVPAEYMLTDYSEKFGGKVNVRFKAESMGECGDHAYWCFESDTHKLTISGTGAMYGYYDDPQPWNDYSDNITSVVIENGITSIGIIAFGGYASLTSITIPDSVESIGADAFNGCTGLTSITLPDSVKSIGDAAFSVCTGLTSIKIPDGVTSIGESAFQGCTSLTSITIPDGVTSIGVYAFCDCTSLASIKIPDSVTSIGNHAFEECTRLESAVIGNSVESIGDRAFYNCTSLTSITIPKNVTSIGTEAFRNCTGITDVYCKADPDTLTWDELGCNDFMLPHNSKKTVCHVPAEYLGKYNSSKFSDVNVRFVCDVVDMGLGEHLYGHSITLDGSIGVNFYVELTDELLASNTAAMVFTVPSGTKTETQTLLVKDVIAQGSNKVVIGGKTYYKFKCSVSAKDMASTITAQLVDGDKAGTEYTYSVKDYADYLLAHAEENEEYANAAPLVQSMLSYGAYSQQLFSEGTPLADSYKGDVSGVDIPATFKYNAAKTILPDGVTLEGATLSLKSETTLSLYFKGLPQDTKFTCAGKTVETAKNGEYVIARIRGIKADELESSFTVTFTGGSVEYSPMTYCYNVLSGGSTDGNLQNVCKALYQYAQAAKAYFGGNN